MTELENGMIVSNENDIGAHFERDNCQLTIHFNPGNVKIYIAFFYCTGSSSNDGTNENLRGAGSGKRLMLDALVYIQQKYSQVEFVSVYPVPEFDTKQIEQICENEIEEFIKSNESMRSSFKHIRRRDYQRWTRVDEALETRTTEKINRYESEQKHKLNTYYKSLGFTGDGPVLYGNLSEIIETISGTVNSGGFSKNRSKSIRRNRSKSIRRNRL